MTTAAAVRPGIRPRVVVEHPDFYLVSKPPMWLTHQTRGRHDVPSVLEYLQRELGEPLLAPPHRLDRETSGAQLLSRDPVAAREFFWLFKEHRLQKTYLCLVHGQPDWMERTVDAPLGFLGLSETNAVQIRQGVTADGREAATRFVRLGTRTHPLHGPLSLIEARPQSGRLHQIRAHLSHIGLPMVGDKIYGRDPSAFVNFVDDRVTPEQRRALILDRQALHAWRLEFPWAGAQVGLEVPLAADIAGLWAEAILSPAD
ncbi:RluA family pseudouridine synthase [Deinococcus altitudinis]|uniref:RluA family pseudouridine synthase n=1 Tax=Deinococcus altitudinis TaxID=468914 RepID=UPI0038928B1D